MPSVRKGGRAVIVGIGPEKIELFSPYVFVYCKDSGYGLVRKHKGEIDRILKLIKMGRLDLSRSISRVLELEQINEGLEKLEKKEGNPHQNCISNLNTVVGYSKCNNKLLLKKEG